MVVALVVAVAIHSWGAMLDKFFPFAVLVAGISLFSELQIIRIIGIIIDVEPPYRIFTITAGFVQPFGLETILFEFGFLAYSIIIIPAVGLSGIAVAIFEPALADAHISDCVVIAVCCESKILFIAIPPVVPCNAGNAGTIIRVCRDVELCT